MEHARRNVFLLACCQALLFTNNVTLISLNGLAGFALADNKAFATLPVTGYVVGAALSTYFASLWMKRVGRRNGFLTGTIFGLAGGAIATLGIWLGSFWTLVLGTLVLGTYNAFGQYYRFAAADATPVHWKARAISLVMAGGLVGGIIGPEMSKFTRDLVQPTFVASYASLMGFCLVTMAILAGLRIPDLKDAEAGRTVRAVLDVGCGEARWRGPLRRARPGLEYVGVDSSRYVVEHFGRSRSIRLGTLGTLSEIGLEAPFDLVICADMLHYVPLAELKHGLGTVASLTAGVAFLEALTTADGVGGDTRGFQRRSAAVYRRLFNAAGFRQCGPHCWAGPGLGEGMAALEGAEP